MIVVIEAWIQHESGIDVHACSTLLCWAGSADTYPGERARSAMFRHISYFENISTWVADGDL